MTFMTKHIRVLALAASCTALGAGVSVITNAGAASTNSSAQNGQAKHAKRAGLRRALGRAVHGDLVIPTKTGFAKATLDRGFVQSVSGPQLTLREGTKTSTYKTVTLTIPAGASVRDNRQAATLSDLKPGQRALVLQGPKRTLVVAHDVRTH
jgi:hypothetical protein